MKKKIEFTVVKKFMDFKKRHKDHTEYVNLDYYRLLEVLSMLHLDNYDFEYKTKFFPGTPKWFTTNVPFHLVAKYIVTFPVSSKKREVYVFDRFRVEHIWKISVYTLEYTRDRILCYTSMSDDGFDTDFVIRYINLLEKKPFSESFKYQYQFILEFQKDEEDRLNSIIDKNKELIEKLESGIESSKNNLRDLIDNRIEIEEMLKNIAKDDPSLGYIEKEE